MEVVVKDLIKVYRIGRIEVQALRGVNLNVDKGEMISIIGPSGSGKTTLLNLIGGLDTATAGLVRVGKTEVTALSVSQLVDYRRRIVGHVFQTLNLVPTLSAAENIGLAMIALGKPRSERRKRVAELLEVAGLTHRANHKPDELSGGEQQRVAVAAALANDPELILADEPTGELDTVNSKIVVDYLSKINEELGKTIIMVTHDPNVARACHRILRIEDGAIRGSYMPAQLGEVASAPYVDQLRGRISEIDEELGRLDEAFRRGRIGGDEYAERRMRLRQTKDVLQDELHRLGD